MFSALAHDHGHLNSKINTFIALAPVASFKFQDSSDTHDEHAGATNAIKTATSVTREHNIYEIGPSLYTI